MCDPDNWIDLRYEHADGTGVAGAHYVVQVPTPDASLTGKMLAEGVLDGNGEAHAELPVGHMSVEVYFHDDPEGEPYEDPEAVATTTEPDGFLEGLWNGAGRAATWTGGVLAGDYDEDPDTSQIITRMALTMIPGVDQVADVQDLSAVLYRLVWKQEWDKAGNWILLLITLIGLIPVLGSLAKGVLKLVWKKADDLLGLFRVFKLFRSTSVRVAISIMAPAHSALRSTSISSVSTISARLGNARKTASSPSSPAWKASTAPSASERRSSRMRWRLSHKALAPSESPSQAAPAISGRVSTHSRAERQKSPSPSSHDEMPLLNPSQTEVNTPHQPSSSHSEIQGCRAASMEVAKPPSCSMMSAAIASGSPAGEGVSAASR